MSRAKLCYISQCVYIKYIGRSLFFSLIEIMKKWKFKDKTSIRFFVRAAEQQSSREQQQSSREQQRAEQQRAAAEQQKITNRLAFSHVT